MKILIINQHAGNHGDEAAGKGLIKRLKSEIDFTKNKVSILYNKNTINELEKIDYEVHYIANEAGDDFSSLHGQYEIDEDIIQLCIKKHSPHAWMEYMYCRATKGVKDKDWSICGDETEVDTSSTELCFISGEGEELLREDIKIANALGVGGSPTWLANNKYQFGGIYAEDVKDNFCKYNDLKGCDTKLSGQSAAGNAQAASAGSCG